MYQANLTGRSLFEAAIQVGQMKGQCVYAQCLYLKDIAEQKLFYEKGYTSLTAFARALWDWSDRKTREMLEISYCINDFPCLCAAFQEGRLCWTKARLLLRGLSNIREQEERLVADKAWSERLHLSYRELECQLTQELGEDAVSNHEFIYSCRWLHQQSDSNAGKVRITMDLPVEAYALWEKATDQIKKWLYEQQGEAEDKDDDPLDFWPIIECLCRQTLSSVKPATKVVAPAEISLQQCPTCQETTLPTGQIGAIKIDKSSIRRLEDGRHIPTATYKKVLEKNQHCCAVSGCRNRLWLHLHHIVPFSEGGAHDPDNLVTLCSKHHRLLHDGKLKTVHLAGGWVFQDQSGLEIGFPYRRRNVRKNCQEPSSREQSSAEVTNKHWERVRLAMDDYFWRQTAKSSGEIPRYQQYEDLKALFG